MIVRDLLIKLGVTSRDALNGLSQVDRQIQKTTGMSRTLGDAMSMAMGQLGAQAINAMVSELKRATDEALVFQKTLGQIQSLIPGNTARAAEYRQEIGRLSVEFGRSAKDLGEGVYDVLSTFGDTADTVKMLEIATKAGAAGNATTGDGIAVLTALTKAYGDTSVATAQKVSDLAFQTVNLGVVKLPELASSMGRATPMAATLGVKMEELFAVMATATGVTGGGAEVSTQMASLMRGLTDRSKEADAAFKVAFKADKFKSIQQAIGKYGLVKVVEMLAKTTDGSAESLNALFGRAEATTLALHITGKGAEDFQTKLKAMKESAGVTDTAYRAMTGGMAKGAHDVDVAKAATEQMRLELGDNLIPALLGWEKVQGRIYKAMSEELIPMMANPTFFEFGTTVDGIKKSFDALGYTIAIVLNGVDMLLGALYTANAFTGAFIAAVDPTEMFSDNGYNNAKAILAQNDKEIMERGRRMYDRIQTASGETSATEWAKIGQQAKLEAAADRTKRAAMIGNAVGAVGGALSGGVASRVLNSTIGAVNVNVAVPAGTTASAAARIGDTGARVLLQQFLAGADRAYPVDTPAGAAERD